MQMINKLSPGDQFMYNGDTYVCGNYADERSKRVTRLRDGRTTTLMTPTLVERLDCTEK